MDEPIITVKGISKKYHIGNPLPPRQERKILRRLLSPFRAFQGMGMPFTAPQEKEFWALKDISFDVYKGERLGIIGRNGAGKTTLLKILSRLVYPTEGEARIRGRVTTLFGVGTGFNGNMTGRNNVYLDATLHGLSRQEIDARFDEIVEFSGVGKFIDTPVKCYSNGMQSRLAFAVAAFLDPDILMLDEVLSVGDMAFQQKCLQKMEGLTSAGRTIFLVSHSMESIMRFCEKVLWLEEGQVVEFGVAKDVTTSYSKRMLKLQASYKAQPGIERSRTTPVGQTPPRDIPQAPGAELLSFEVLDAEHQPKEIFFRHEQINIETKFRVLRQDIPLVVSVHIIKDNVHVMTTHCSKTIQEEINTVWIGKTNIPADFLNTGDYSFSIAIVTPARPKWQHVYLEKIVSLKVVEAYNPDRIFSGEYRGVVRPQFPWEYIKISQE